MVTKPNGSFKVDFLFRSNAVPWLFFVDQQKFQYIIISSCPDDETHSTHQIVLLRLLLRDELQTEKKIFTTTQCCIASSEALRIQNYKPKNYVACSPTIIDRQPCVLAISAACNIKKNYYDFSMSVIHL